MIIENKDIKLALITIGNGNWEKVIEDIWKSLDINEEGYKLDRAYECYFSKLNIKNTELPVNLTNYDLNLGNLERGYTLRLIIAPPVISNYKFNNDMVSFPYWDSDIKYGIGSKGCVERIIGDKECCDNVIVLLGDRLDLEERNYRDTIADLCVENGKTFWELGNDCGCTGFNMIIKWLESGENYCGYYGKGIKYNDCSSSNLIPLIS